MIRWLMQTVTDHPDLTAGRPSAGLLTPAELASYEQLLSPRRRRDWLLGRWTAKRLFQRQIATHHGFMPSLDSFTIAQAPSGAPYIASHHPALRANDGSERLPFALSISHSNGYAICALAEDRYGITRVGVDIEVVEPRSDSFIQEFFTPAEQANLSAAPPLQRDLFATALWSAKEATLKATHVGLHADPRAVECLLSPACPRHWRVIHIKITESLRTQTLANGPLRAWWRVVENRLRPGTSFAVALAAFNATL